jgi:hypothetical protein
MQLEAELEVAADMVERLEAALSDANARADAAEQRHAHLLRLHSASAASDLLHTPPQPLSVAPEPPAANVAEVETLRKELEDAHKLIYLYKSGGQLHSPVPSECSPGVTPPDPQPPHRSTDPALDQRSASPPLRQLQDALNVAGISTRNLVTSSAGSLQPQGSTLSQLLLEDVTSSPGRELPHTYAPPSSPNLPKCNHASPCSGSSTARHGQKGAVVATDPADRRNSSPAVCRAGAELHSMSSAASTSPQTCVPSSRSAASGDGALQACTAPRSHQRSRGPIYNSHASANDLADGTDEAESSASVAGHTHRQQPQALDKLVPELKLCQEKQSVHCVKGPNNPVLAGPASGSPDFERVHMVSNSKALQDELIDMQRQLTERNATIGKLQEALSIATASAFNQPEASFTEAAEPSIELNALWSALHAAQADAASERSAHAEALMHVESLRGRIATAEACRDEAVAEIASAIHSGLALHCAGSRPAASGHGSLWSPGEKEGELDTVAVAMRVRRIAERVCVLDAQLEAAQGALQEAQDAACEVRSMRFFIYSSQ